ncbi:unnamed protein product [Merluccius merluccius]
MGRGPGTPPANHGEVLLKVPRIYSKVPQSEWGVALALKMDGAGASGPYPAVAGDRSHVGYAAMSRRAAAVSTEA